jgi:membrane protein implicated in regulation of membrane protease activity
MQNYKFKIYSLFLLTLSFCCASSLMAKPGDSLILYGLIFGVTSVFALWFAAVLVVFGVQFLTALLAGYLILGLSVFSAVIGQDMLPKNLVKDESEEHPVSESTTDLGMNLS